MPKLLSHEYFPGKQLAAKQLAETLPTRQSDSSPLFGANASVIDGRKTGGCQFGEALRKKQSIAKQNLQFATNDAYGCRKTIAQCRIKMKKLIAVDSKSSVSQLLIAIVGARNSATLQLGWRLDH